MRYQEHPYTLIAELTYRCPLGCAYCSNPLDYRDHTDQLDTPAWIRVFQEAEDLGVLQVNLTGGEPLVRDDLEQLVRGARASNLYTNLITSGVPLTQDRLMRLSECGLDSIQISIQDVGRSESDRIAGLPSFDRKLRVACWAKELHIPLTLNIVLHRMNLDRIADMVALAEELRVDRLELANTQYLGWALWNRVALLPTSGQVEGARVVAARARQRLHGKMEVVFVKPDYYGTFPKACMDGWGRRFIVVTPDGLALPCHAAHTIPGLLFDRVSERPLSEIWRNSSGFNAYRGEAWMPQPCRSCERRTIDFGGCRCQAYHLTGNAGATDPACALSPQHNLIESARARATIGSARRPFTYRTKRVAGLVTTARSEQYDARKPTSGKPKRDLA